MPYEFVFWTSAFDMKCDGDYTWFTWPNKTMSHDAPWLPGEPSDPVCQGTVVYVSDQNSGLCDFYTLFKYHFMCEVSLVHNYL